MNIVIVGGGTVGSAICAQLALEDHNVTIVDADPDSLAEIANSCDVFGVVGNGAELSVLRKAGAEDADLLIAVSPEDEINILCCAAAKKLGTSHTVARVRNPEYTELMRLLQSEMNLSFTINPELTAAKEIYRLLRFPSAAKIDTFCHGKVELAEFTVAADSPLCGLTLIDLRKKLSTRFLVCGVLRDGEAYIPAGDFLIRAGDTIGVTAPDKEIAKFFKEIGVYKNPVKNVLIVGGGRTTYYLEQMLKEGKIKSTVVERDAALCEELANDYRDCTVICDNGTRQETLLEAGIDRADAFLALSGVDEENAIISMYAKTREVGKIITMISRISYVDFFKSAGLESIVSPRSSTASYILRYVRSFANSADSSAIESLHKIMNDRIEALELSVKDDIPELTDLPLKRIRPRAGVLIACIVRGGDVIIPGGDDCIKKGDSVIIMSTGNRINSLKDII
jgi:trk system potassium uptake protein TrkA